MTSAVQKLLKVYPNEIKLLLWVVGIQFTVNLASALLNNYSDAAFLKRYGVEYLPNVIFINTIMIFMIMNVMGMFVDRFRITRVFSAILLFFAVTVAIVRGLLPFNIPVLYPVLYMLKATAIGILPLLFMDILNDLYTTRQSKRLFTLVSAGGLLGTVLASFLTGTLARLLGEDNVLWIFIGGMTLSALLNERTEGVVGAPIQPRTDRRKKKGRGKLKDTIRDMHAFAKQSPFLKYMIILMAIPNMVLPILTYQFNVVVDHHFASERETLNFFGIFRAFYNTWIFVILLFSGRLLNRLGVGTSLLFHPINYLIAFLSLFFRFDLLTAIYARMSTETLKMTLNNPARGVLYNFFPPAMRVKVRIFLRGTVVRAAKLGGAGLLMLFKGFVPASALSLVAAPFVVMWILANITIRRRYASLVIQTLMDKQIDWRRLEDVNLKELAKDRSTLETLQRGLREESPEVATLCGEILAQISPPGWANWIVDALPGRPLDVQRTLLQLLPQEVGPEVVSELLAYAEKTPPEVLAELMPELMRLDPNRGLPLVEALVDHPDGGVKARALVSLYLSGDPMVQQRCRRILEGLIEERDPLGLRIAIEVLAECGDPAFSQTVLDCTRSEGPEIKAPALRALGRMRAPEALERAVEAIEDPSPPVRRAALQVFIEFGEDAPLDQVLRLLADEDAQVREMASQAIRQRGEEVVQALIPALASPSRTLRNEILEILGHLESRPVELSQFINRELGKAYQNLVYLSVLQPTDQGTAIPLLRGHLVEKNGEILEIVLRVLAVQEFGDKMEVIRRALQTGDKRDIDNAIEALETELHSGIRKVLVPLLEDIPLEEKLAVGEKRLGVSSDDARSPRSILLDLLEDDDPVTQALALYALAEDGDEEPPREAIQRHLEARDPLVRSAADWALPRVKAGEPAGEAVEDGTPFLDKLLHVRKIPMFQDLRIRELMAITSITLERRCSKRDVVVREGDPGDNLYLVLEGDLTVIKGMGTGQEMTLDHIHADDFFGEMALFDRNPRSASVVADSDALLLEIREAGFTNIMEQHPAIPINVCRVFSGRVRGLHERFGLTEENPPPQ